MLMFGSPQSAKPDFEKVVDQELPLLYRVALRLARNPSEAEDLVGQTLYLAARAWAVFDGAHPRAWLLRILRNEHLGTIRKHQITTSLDETSEPSTEGYWQEIDWSLIGEQILKVLDMLPEDYRLAVTLCDVEELTREEAAEALEIPIGTINSRLHRGRAMLRAKLASLLPDQAREGLN